MTNTRPIRQGFSLSSMIKKNCSLLLLFLLSKSLSEILDSSEVSSSHALETSD